MCGQVDHALGFMGLEQFGHARSVGHVHADMGVVGVVSLAGQPGFLQRGAVVVVVVIDADNGVATLKQS